MTGNGEHGTTLGAGVVIRRPLDPERLDALRGIGGDTFVAQVLVVYRDELAQQRAAIRAAVEAGDAAAVTALSHALKSVSLNVGALPIAELCAKLQQDAAQGVLKDAGTTLRELALEHERLLPEMEARWSPQ